MYRWVLLAVCTAIFVGGVGYVVVAQSSESSAGDRVPEEIASKAYRDFWLARAERDGGAVAYEAFKYANNAAAIGEQHLASHVMGNVLYETEGIEGVVVCDNAFGFGCFHGLFSIALASEGVEAVNELDAACVDRFGVLGTGCMHGIGHGILEYVGYDQIGQALDLCKQTTQLVSILGCTSGVFMEHNTPLEEDTNGLLRSVAREFSSTDPYGVCDGIEQAQDSCYFELAAWWALALDEDWGRMEELCSALSDTRNRQFCFLGFGHALGTMVSYDTGKILPVCEAVNDAAGSTLCRAGAYWALFANSKLDDAESKLCDGATAEKCRAWGRPDRWVDAQPPRL